MADRFAPGDRVRASREDPRHHSRVPRYARGALGTVLAVAGHHPLADDVARAVPAEPEAVYRVRFGAGELFGEGDHDVVLEVWQSRLAPAEVGELTVSGDR